MRTYSHALLTWATAQRLAPARPRAVVAATAGAVLPDLPAVLGAVWLWAKRRTFSREDLDSEVCSKRRFGGPDAALHSALPAGAALALYGLLGTRGAGGTLSAFLFGWAGHVAVDALTHARDARPILWPLSGRRFRSPLSYWDPAHHSRPFTLVEHASLLLIAVRALARRL